MRALAVALVLIALSLLIVLSAVKLSAAPAPHLTSGPGTSPSVTALSNEVQSVVAERDALRIENSALKQRISELEAAVEQLMRLQQRDSGLRVPPTLPKP